MTNQSQILNAIIERVACRYCRNWIYIFNQETEFHQGFHNDCHTNVESFREDKSSDLFVIKELEDLWGNKKIQ